MNQQRYTSEQVEEISVKYKDLGNKFFKAGDFYSAIENYNEALVNFLKFLESNPSII